MRHHDLIYSPMPRGNGAYVVHRCLSKHIDGYEIADFHPAVAYFPPLLLKAITPRRTRLVHTCPDHAIFFTRPATPLIITFHNFVLDAFMRPFSSAAQWLHYRTDLALFTRLAVQRAARITSVSRFTAELVRRELRIERDIEVIPNGVDTGLFSPGKKRTGHPVRVFFSGNLTKRKGSQWLEAIADRLNPDICLYATQGLRGHGTVRQSSSMRLMGPVPLAQMPDRYREMDILLLPTVREGCSMSVLEAMACGLPVVASNCSSLPEQIEDGKGGYLCPVGDVEAFAEKINLLAASSRMRREMGDYNRDRAETKFTIDRMIAGYQSVFNEVIKHHS